MSEIDVAAAPMASAAGTPPRAPATARAGGKRGPLASLAREPLLHFAVLAGLIFGADRLLHPPSQADRTIVVTKAQRQQLIDLYDEDKQRKPSPEELQKLVDFWVAGEILFREGKAMGLDRGDDMIKARVGHKLQLLIFSDIDVGLPSEEEFQAWFAKNRWRYDVPQTLNFYVANAKTEQEARDDVARIAAGQESAELEESARAFVGRPTSTVVATFGDEFVKALMKLPRGQWQPLQSKDGWHVVRLDGVTEGEPATLDTMRDKALQDWKGEATRRRANEALAKLKTNYIIRDEGAP